MGTACRTSKNRGHFAKPAPQTLGSGPTNQPPFRLYESEDRSRSPLDKPGSAAKGRKGVMSLFLSLIGIGISLFDGQNAADRIRRGALSSPVPGRSAGSNLPGRQGSGNFPWQPRGDLSTQRLASARLRFDEQSLPSPGGDATSEFGARNALVAGHLHRALQPSAWAKRTSLCWAL